MLDYRIQTSEDASRMILRKWSTLFEHLLGSRRGVASEVFGSRVQFACSVRVFASRVRLLVDQPNRLKLF
jgi:hypothetical protein